ncbi:hypothetical protein [Sphingomonas morindae]|uniref:SGNH/GDSL hydrolase family protein n=1 Tax=Sphingomonas morindae TaxID=1541170 RepID=A0ABY4X770_9SPHN|nr:hypothetical protein [Sphingomonas morindae]USI72705.1 hypothetical protein LHA26_15745 [Sphingomonas morindae]
MRRLFRALGVALAALALAALALAAAAAHAGMTPDGMNRADRALHYPLAWRGNAQGLRVAAQGFNPGRYRALTWRLRQYSHTPFRRVRLVIPLTSPSETSGTGSISGTTLTITDWTSGAFNPGAILAGAAGSALAPGTQILAQLTNANPQGIAGREGSYQVSIAQTLASGPINGPIADSFYPYPLRFQAALEPVYARAVTGLEGRRPLFTFNGASSVSYDPASWDRSRGYILSDVLDIGAILPARAAYGLWFTTELAAPAAGQIPYTKLASSFLNRHEGQIASATDSQIDAATAATATSVAPWTTAQTGQAGPFTPAMLLIEGPAFARSVATVGDSIAYMVGEGVAGSGDLGDVQGSALGNAGYIERGLYEVAGVNQAINVARGSDKANYSAAAPEGIRYRLQLLALANPTGVINEYGHNDLAGGTPYLSRANASPYLAGTVLLYGGTLYVVTTGGVSGASPPSVTTPGVDITDGTLTLRVAGTGAATAQARIGLAALAANMVLNQRIQAAVGPVPIAQALVTPDAASTDKWATTVNQSPSRNWSDAGGARATLNAAIRALPADLRASQWIDPNAYVEGDASALGKAGVETGKWIADGSSSGFTNDGIHPNSHGHAEAARVLTPDRVP